MKFNKALFATLTFLILLIANESLACGGCVRLYIWNVKPFYLGFYFIAALYGVATYCVYIFSRLISLKSVLASFIIYLFIVYLFYIIGTEGSLGTMAFITGSFYCFIVPHYLLRKKASGSKIETPKKILLALIPVFLIAAFIFSAQWQNRTTKYFNAHLIEMIDSKSLITAISAADELELIEDEIERKKYVSQLKELSITGTTLAKRYSLEILEHWGYEIPLAQDIN